MEEITIQLVIGNIYMDIDNTKLKFVKRERGCAFFKPLDFHDYCVDLDGLIPFKEEVAVSLLFG